MAITIPPRVAAIHDLSCIGRCSLTVAIPILSTLGVQAVPVPTALLSTQTDGYGDLFFRDLSAEMDEIAAHFDRLNLEFDAVYSGFLGDIRQIEHVKAFIERFGGKLALVDPVMGDGGALYQTYTPQLAAGMRELCRHADIITPNYTEACFLTETPYYPEETFSEDELMARCDAMAEQLCAMGPDRVVITGIYLRGTRRVDRCGDSVVRTLAYDGTGRFVCDRPYLNAHYPGTGDIFASVFLGALLSGDGFCDAVTRACAFVEHTIRVTREACPDTSFRREGVLLEPCLGWLFEHHS